MGISAEDYAARRAAGLCGTCGIRPSRPERVHCEECARSFTENKNKLKELGLCTRCKAPVEWDHVTCPSCTDKMREHLSRQHQRRLDEKVCTRCEGPLDRPFKTCSKCAEIEKQYRANRIARLRAEGKCERCGQRDAIPDQTRCPECAEKQLTYYTENVDLNAARERSRKARDKAIREGKCRKCHKKRPAKDRTQCSSCIAKDQARAAIARANKKKARLAAQGVVSREAHEVVTETVRQQRARVKIEKTALREKQLQQLPPAAELKAKMDEHNLAVHDIATLHGIPESVVRAHLATIGVKTATRNGWQTKNDAKRAAALGT